ncbi:hypothetical protein MKI84_12610 [Ancylobacter sp. A5.8]|uniref:hypothetical protein n=1 Tax=Ancylobacter gelatini TaxID=2919920 RepID=UPI001F4E9FB0|nr:hypothetical protein [Ancylobacter gelatini]MCJ8143758.1 hypothetical protein [Ancylobacter gelatini]
MSHHHRPVASRTVIAVALIASFGLGGMTAASAGGRSKDDRKAFWQTLHESRQPWGRVFHTQKAAPEKAPAASTAKPKS